MYHIGSAKIVILFSLLLREVTSFPDGAGGCQGGSAAVGGSHLGGSDGRVVSNSTLETGGVIAMIGNIVLSSNTPIDLEVGVDHNISVISTQFPIRGVLIRVEAAAGVDTSAILTPGALTQMATACVAPIVGTTHADSTDKDEVTSIIRLDESLDEVIIDITGVFVNGLDGSVFVYTRYIVNFVANMTTVEPEPTAAPSTVQVPTVSPVFVESEPPSAVPVIVATPAPTAAPFVAETDVPTVTPVSVKTDAPTTSPVSSTMEPTETPVSVETTVPTISPITTTMEPTETPVGAPVTTPKTTKSPIPSPVEKTSEPSLRGDGKGKGMMRMGMKSSDNTGVGKGKDEKGMMNKDETLKGSGKGGKEKKDMKKSKVDGDKMDKKHSMQKIAKSDS